MGVTQGAFREALLDPASTVPDGLIDPEGRQVGKRFDVYRNNVVASLSDGLASGFPTIAKLLGPDHFRMIAVAYSRAHPPSSPLMMQMGGALPAFLAGFKPLAAYPYLSDAARLDLAVRESYHAADASPVDPAQLTELAPEDLEKVRFTLAPALRVVESRYPIVQIRSFNLEDGPKPVPGAECALVTRPQFDPMVTALSPADAQFVRALIAGTSLGDAAHTASELDETFDPTPVLGALFSGQAITALHIDQDQGPLR